MRPRGLFSTLSLKNHMSQVSNPYAYTDVIAQAPESTRADFIRKTYLHLFGAILAFVGLEFALFQVLDVETITRTMLGGGYSWLIVLGLFLVVSWVAHRWASSTTSLPLQYAGWGCMSWPRR